MKTLIYIFLGGGAGSISRYLVGRYSAFHLWPGFPVGTLLANILASLLLGYVSVKSFSTGFGDQADELWKPLLAVGFCGGFSTFSTFSLESFKYFQSAQIFHGNSAHGLEYAALFDGHLGWGDVGEVVERLPARIKGRTTTNY